MSESELQLPSALPAELILLQMERVSAGGAGGKAGSESVYQPVYLLRVDDRAIISDHTLGVHLPEVAGDGGVGHTDFLGDIS